MNEMYFITVRYKGTWWASLVELAPDKEDALEAAWETMKALGVQSHWRNRYTLEASRVANIELEGGNQGLWSV